MTMLREDHLAIWLSCATDKTVITCNLYTKRDKKSSPGDFGDDKRKPESNFARDDQSTIDMTI